MAPIREDVLFVVDQAFQTLITVKSVFNKKRIGMDAQKLWTLAVRKRIFSMNEKNMVSKSDEKA